jgi:hypothetical protein
MMIRFKEVLPVLLLLVSFSPVLAQGNGFDLKIFGYFQITLSHEKIVKENVEATRSPCSSSICSCKSFGAKLDDVRQFGVCEFLFLFSQLGRVQPGRSLGELSREQSIEAQARIASSDVQQSE